MKHRLRILSLLFLFVFSVSPVLAQNAYDVQAVNVEAFSVEQYPLTVELSKLPERFGDRELAVRNPDGEYVPSQVDDLDGDSQPDELVFLSSVSGNDSKTYTIQTGTSTSPAHEGLQLNSSGSFQNERINVRSTDEHRISVQDRRSGKKLVTDWGLRRGELTFQERSLVASGPVRIVVEQTYRINGSPLQLIERFTLFAGTSRLDHRLLFSNPTSEAHPLPNWATNAKRVLEGNQGPLLTRQWSEVEILSVNFYETNRSNMLWVNPATGHGMGLVLHTPYSDWYGPIRWITPVYKSFSGRVTHARPQHGWVVPEAEPSEYDGRRHRKQKGKIGPVGRFADISPDEHRPTYKSRWFHNSAQPFRVPPDGRHPIDLSLVFYQHKDDPARTIRQFERDASGVVGTVHLFHPDNTGKPPLKVANSPEHVRDTFDSASRRWRTRGETEFKVNNGRAHVSSTVPGNGIRTYVTRDFIDPAEVRGEVSSIREGTTLRVRLRDLDSGETHRVGEVSEAGRFRLPVKPEVPFNDYRTCELLLTLHGDGDRSESMRVSLKQFSFDWITPPPPKLVTPDEGMNLTDVAMSVSLLSETPQRADRGYEVQVADNPSFNDPVMNEKVSLKMRVSGATHRDETFLPDRVLDKGTYYCRVRSLGISGNPGEWTEVRRFSIDSTDHETRPLVRAVHPDRPMFLIPANLPHRFRKMMDNMPPAVRKHTVAQVGYGDLVNSPDRLQAWIETDVPVIFRFYGHTSGNLAYAEHLFRTSDNFVGFTFGESGFPGKSMKRGVKLAGKYGRIAGNYGGLNQIGMGSEREFFQLLGTHGQYIMGLPKGQHPGFIGERYSPITGLWLSDRVDFWACETEYWVPHHLGIQNRDQHAVDWMPPFLFGLSTGASAWRVETFIGYKKMYGWAPPRYDEKDYLSEGFGPLWTHAMGPFFQDVLKHDLIPDRSAVRRKIDTAMLSTVDYLRKPLSFPERKTKAAHGEPSNNRQWIPESNRGYLVPMLPPLATEAEKNRFKYTTYPHKFDTVDEANAYFERHNPADDSEAYDVLVDDTIVITNTHPEDHPDDNVEPEPYARPLSKGPVNNIEGTVGYHQYLVGKQKADELFLHLNNYPGKTSRVVLHPRDNQDLSITVRPESALVSEEAEGEAISIKLRHNHGPVRLFAR